jgi:hypothetical protein
MSARDSRAVETCQCCGAPTGGLSIRLGEPDDPDHGPWPDGLNPYRAECSFRGVGNEYFRALLEIRLCGKHTLLYCVWVRTDDVNGRKCRGAWWEPDIYAGLRFTGRMASRIGPWGLLGAEVAVAVRDPATLPRIESSPDPVMNRVLRDAWPYETAVPVLQAH